MYSSRGRASSVVRTHARTIGRRREVPRTRAAECAAWLTTALTEVHHGLEGVVAFETQIAEPDKEGSALRYRGVDIEDIVGRVPFENVWGLLIDGAYTPGLPPAEPYNIADPHRRRPRRRPGGGRDARAGVRAWARPTTSATSRPALDLSRVAVMVLSYAAQSARGLGTSRSSRSARSTRARTLAEKFLIRWQGEADPEHVKAIDAYWSSAAEHGMNASTFTARVITSTGADVAAAFSGAIGAMSGPLHGGAPARVLEHDRGGRAVRRRRRPTSRSCSTPASG